ncbi:MAG: symmetrical bis(5'-nucleosyl)-tetraphosphatase [Magnetococcales bacterium]|nr:symmetrical bis(5'-nucleosyl)-tetraphosphatase [Magnetococcales bacterium]NGZ06226.1 symmetrical bis(5'-nucleosyl)-tetraphosphatase [Magnetococcales bacterium]
MAVYAIGDVHGCLSELRMLLKEIAFQPGRDRLWFVGDIINRGPDSLGTLRLVRDLGDRAVTLMGNHELRAVSGLSGCPDRAFSKQMGFVQQAEDRAELYAWLRALPLMHHDPELGVSMVHAGLFPGWDQAQAIERARRLEKMLRDDATIGTLLTGFGSDFPDWEPQESASEVERLQFALAVMTRLRICHSDGRIVWSIPGETSGTAFRLTPDSPYRPWHRLLAWPGRIIYGHWAVAGLTRNDPFIGLDSGCVYGGKLTAIRVDHPDMPVTQVPCSRYVVPE